jgi:uncharacterized membrane protein YphA (DoxX/SURF4 family)
MNRLDWFAQILVAGVFLIAGLSKILDLQRHASAAGSGPGFQSNEMPHGLAWAIGLLEIAGALALVVPLNLWRPDILPLVAAVGLALLTLGICFYRARRREPAAPVLAMFLLTLFVIIGHLR